MNEEKSNKIIDKINELINNNPLYVITMNDGILKNNQYEAFFAFSKEDAQAFIESESSKIPVDCKLAYIEVSNTSDCYGLRGFFKYNAPQILFINHGSVAKEDLLKKNQENIDFLTEYFIEKQDNYLVYLVLTSDNEIYRENGYQAFYLSAEEAKKVAESINGHCISEEVVGLVFKNCIQDFAEYSINSKFVSGWDINEAVITYFKKTMMSIDDVISLIDSINSFSIWAATDNSGAILLNYNNTLLFTNDTSIKRFDKSCMTHPCNKFDIANLMQFFDLFIVKLPGDFIFIDAEKHCTKEVFYNALKVLKDRGNL